MLARGVVKPNAISNKYYPKWLKVKNKNKFISIYEGKENKDVNDEFNLKPIGDRIQELLEKYP
jgi:hypothetical protein